MSSASLALYQCLKSLFKVTDAVTYFLGTKSPQNFGLALNINKNVWKYRQHKLKFIFYN